MAAGVGFHHCLTVFEMIFYAAKLEIDMLLQFFGKRRKGLILQTVQKYAAANLYRSDFLPAAIKYGFMESSSHHRIFFSVPPFDQYRLLIAKYRNGVMMRRVHFSDLRKLPAVKESVLHGQLRLRQKRAR